ncbi:MAG: ATP-binding protein [Spirochaetota bacterium]
MSDFLDPANQELLQDFFVEAELQVELLEQNILVLEKDSRNADAIDEIFRAAHTLKGASATVQMDELTQFTHLVEDVFDSIREGKSSVDERLVDVLLDSVDIIKAMLEARSEGSVYDGDVSELKNGLRAVLDGSSTSPAKPDAPAVAEGTPAVKPGTESSEPGLSEYEVLELKEAAGSGTNVYQVRVLFNEDNPMNTVGGIQVFAALKSTGEVLKTDPDFESLYDDVYHPEVRYYLASDIDAETITTKASIHDVTTDVQVSPVEVQTEQSQAGSTDTDQPPPVHETPRQAVPAESTPAETVTVDSSSDEDSSESGAVEAVKRGGGSSSVLRVDSRRIDNLLNLVSETVIVKAGFNQLVNEFSDSIQSIQTTESEYRDSLKDLFDSLPQYLEQIRGGVAVKDVKRTINERFGSLFDIFDGFDNDLKAHVTKFRAGSQNLARISGELQQGVMRIRMVPISNIFSRFPRLVRDLSRSLDKKINLVIEGEDTELDKSVIEDLLDPLIHCVRNSLDHGIESPAERLEGGKPETGTLTLRASNEGNMILIEVSDDGKGIDVEKVKARAIDRGVIHPTKQLTDVEAFNLIFEPGFSTAAKVTDISGRGVGLDVVRKQIEKLNGTVSVWSEPGLGSRFTIKIPLNRLFRVSTDENRDYYFVVVVGSGEKRMGLIVDELIGEEDVVIKPLRDHYTNVPGIAGANITGDGTVSLIIDVAQLLELGLKQEREHRERRETTIRQRTGGAR